MIIKFMSKNTSSEVYRSSRFAAAREFKTAQSSHTSVATPCECKYAKMSRSGYT